MNTWPWYQRPIVWVGALAALGIARVFINSGPAGVSLSAVSALAAVAVVGAVIVKVHAKAAPWVQVVAGLSGLLFLGGIAYLAYEDAYSAEIGGAVPATLGLTGLIVASLATRRPDAPA